jgi:hypothetical protein
MNCKTITMLATAAVLLWPAAAHAEGTVSASADCEVLNVDVAGFPDGTAVFVSEGQQPPFGFVVGTGPFWDFTPQPGGGSTRIPISLYDREHEFAWSVGTIEEPMIAGGTVDCTPASTTTPVDPVVPATPAPAAEPGGPTGVAIWASVELAPPW